MVLPQELHHFPRFHGSVDADRRRGFAVPPAILTHDHPTTVGALHDFGMVDLAHRSTPRQPRRLPRTIVTAPERMPGRRGGPVGTRRFREPPVAASGGSARTDRYPVTSAPELRLLWPRRDLCAADDPGSPRSVTSCSI